MAARRPLARFLSYTIFGGMGAALDFGLFTALLWSGVWAQGANAAGYLAGTLLSFFLNRALTFQTRDKPVVRLMMFLAVGFVGFSVSALALWSGMTWLGLDPIVAKLIAMGLVLVVQFTLNSLFTFRPTGGR